MVPVPGLKPGYPVWEASMLTTYIINDWWYSSKKNTNILNIYIHFLYNIIQNISHLWPCLTYAFKSPEVDRKYVLLLPEMFLHQKQANNIWWVEAPTYGTYIAPEYLFTPETEWSISKCGRVTFHR